jgi:pimeloyl-ACP methyl ester carboxylesterase
VIVGLHRRGYDGLQAVENPLTSVADDATRTQTMIRRVDGPVLLVGHSHGGAVITEAGGLENVVGLVCMAVFAPDAGESPVRSPSRCLPRRRATSRRTPDGYVWIAQEKLRESFCQDLSADAALVMVVTQKAPRGSTFGNPISAPRSVAGGRQQGPSRRRLAMMTALPAAFRGCSAPTPGGRSREYAWRRAA